MEAQVEDAQRSEWLEQLQALLDCPSPLETFDYHPPPHFSPLTTVQTILLPSMMQLTPDCTDDSLLRCSLDPISTITSLPQRPSDPRLSAPCPPSVNLEPNPCSNSCLDRAVDPAAVGPDSPFIHCPLESVSASQPQRSLDPRLFPAQPELTDLASDDPRLFAPRSLTVDLKSDPAGCPCLVCTVDSVSNVLLSSCFQLHFSFSEDD